MNIVQDNIFQLEELLVDIDRKIIYINNKELNFAPCEVTLFMLLVKNSKKKFYTTKEDIITELYNIANEPKNPENNILVYINRIRKKMKIASNGKQWIEHKTGLGYRLQSANLISLSHRTKLTEDERKEITMNTVYSESELSDIYKVHKYYIRQLRRRSSLVIPKYTKLKAITEVISGNTIPSVARKYNINQDYMYKLVEELNGIETKEKFALKLLEIYLSQNL